ncbi:neuroligin-3-like, partial [Pollicipes pollicipes]|uniref:neuroligin-3-like n=1 Tax=Pollicipes pollicipes TaxID=41117 RepID=UPI0018855D61
RLGSVHGSELPYVFGDPLLPAAETGIRYTSGPDLSRAVVALWTNFAKTGCEFTTDGAGGPERATAGGARRSSGRERSRYRAVTWPPYNATHRSYLNLGSKLRVRSRYRAREVAFWARLVPLQRARAS